jgi:hypothetical protein
LDLLCVKVFSASLFLPKFLGGIINYNGLEFGWTQCIKARMLAGGNLNGFIQRSGGDNLKKFSQDRCAENYRGVDQAE